MSTASATAESLLEALRRFWGYESFRPLQQEAMTCVLEDRDSLVVLPTGGGKSLCYQAPAVCRDGLAVVVSPLISLMKDQVDSLRTCGIAAAFINSTQSYDEKQSVADQVRDGELNLLYIAPERLVLPQTIDFLSRSNLAFIAIDEAHCISDWGHDFRPEYRELSILREALPGISLHAFTATATERVRDDIVRQLRLCEPERLVGSFDRPNLIYRCERRDGVLQQIREVIDRHPKESGIIYCNSRNETTSLSGQLNELGFRTLPYHAGMTDIQRRRNQESFIDETVDTIVATIAFGMGIDKSNVRYVIHTGMPKSLEGYQQESGRAGRDGLESECLLLYSMSDYAWWRKVAEDGSTSSYEAAIHTLQAMTNYATGVCCRHQTLVRYFGEDYGTEPCNACDVCLGDLNTISDALVIGQKILSCVIRQGQRFGADYTSQVLKGSQAQRIIDNGHDKLSTWGLLEEYPQSTIRSWVEQLVSQGYLNRVGEYSTLEVAPRGRELLKGEATPQLLKPTSKKARKKRRAARTQADWEGVDRELFDGLRSVRQQAAFEAGVRAWVVFTDETLRDLARHRPSTLDGMARIKGIGEKRLADHGQRFLDHLVQYCRESGLSLNEWDSA